MKTYRPLTAEEITQLQQQQCICCDWSLIEVSKDFCANNIIQTFFSGKIRLGSFRYEFVLADGIRNPSGIYQARLHNCTVGDDVYIAHVHSQIANYEIGNRAYISNIDCLTVEGESSFGNGVQVAVLDETGSRSLPIYAGLSAQVAYLLTWYKFEPKAIDILYRFIEKKTQDATSTIGKIGANATILNCGTIRNVQVGDFAEIKGVSLLENGTILSSEKAPVVIGTNVIARDFIISSSSQVTDGVQLERTFVGQGCMLSKQFSAIDSLFFANSQGFHGEAVSVFAAPFTVTHHKSTLLIGGMFSFFNAGSGSNQSNHMYKLGPIHYGVLDRGSKMASDSYLPAPSRVAAFSVIMGKHKNKIDASDFPFSYLIAEGNNTTVIPALMLQSIGTYRDASKWKSRDIRTDNPIDIISFDLLNPYTIGQILKGLQKLMNNDYAFADKKISVKPSSIDRAIELYTMAVKLYIGDAVNKRITENKPLESKGETYTDWVDCGGMITPNEKMLDLMESLQKEEISSIDDFQQKITAIHADYESLEWNYIFYLYKKIKEHDIDLDSLLEKWSTAKTKLKELLLTDAQKEYCAVMKTNFGLNQSAKFREEEFELLRGRVQDNSFLKSILED
jgi:hypothetical protein